MASQDEQAARPALANSKSACLVASSTPAVSPLPSRSWPSAPPRRRPPPPPLPEEGAGRAAQGCPGGQCPCLGGAGAVAGAASAAAAPVFEVLRCHNGLRDGAGGRGGAAATASDSAACPIDWSARPAPLNRPRTPPPLPPTDFRCTGPPGIYPLRVAIRAQTVHATQRASAPPSEA